jgi:hypothetical protein
MKLNTHLREDRTVALWNELREQAKLEYDPEVIRMLDASGFIVKWLDK